MDLVNDIEIAFEGVAPGVVGIRQARALDQRIEPGGLYEDQAQYRKMCEADRAEKRWQDIPDEVLAGDPAFPFFDDLGFKFVLPAIMSWAARNKFNPKFDPNDVAEFLLYCLLPESRKSDKPEQLSVRWKLSTRQIGVVIDWIDGFVSARNYQLESLELEQLERWKSLLKSV